MEDKVLINFYMPIGIRVLSGSKHLVGETTERAGLMYCQGVGESGMCPLL